MKRRKENTEIFGAKDAPIDDINMINDDPIIIFFLPNLKIKCIEFYYSALAIYYIIIIIIIEDVFKRHYKRPIALVQSYLQITNYTE